MKFQMHLKFYRLPRENNSMNILITICGRAGSKGVKNKNIRNFYGYPLVFYTVAAAYIFKDRNNELNIDISINSDSDELLSFFKNNKDIETIKREKELSLDDTPKVKVIKSTLIKMESVKDIKYDFIIDLDITSPFRKSTDIEDGFQKILQEKSLDVVFSVVNARRNPYFNMIEEKDGEIKKIIDSDFVIRQEAPTVYDMNASIYVYRRSSLFNNIIRSPLDGKFGFIKMKDTAVLDIDSEEDFTLMEVLAKYFFETEFKELYESVYKIFDK